MFYTFNFKETSTAIATLFPVIDIIGSIPIILALKSKGRSVHALRATLIASALLLVFFYAGEWMLDMFNIRIQSFAIAGGLVLAIMAIEMLLDVELFKNNGPIKESTLIPIVFPLIAGPAAFTTLLTLRSSLASVNIIIGLIVNMVIVYIVISNTNVIKNFLGEGGVYIVRKFFAIILLAIAAETIISNIASIVV